MQYPILLSSGLRMFKRSIRVRFKGIKEYKGDPKQICYQIIDDCWNGKYFQVSNGHFREFYCRDFGLCIDALLGLGYNDKVEKTLDYALNIFQKYGKITQTISPKGKPYDLFRYSPDSVAFLVRSLTSLGSKELVKKYKEFLNKEIMRYFNLVVDKETGLVKKNNDFSSIKDYSIRSSSCYNNIMTAMLKNNIEKLDLVNPFKNYNLKKIIKEKFWTGEYFIDDLSGNNFVTGDSNVFSFWSGVFTEKDMLKKSIQSMRKQGLDKPFPLRYYHEKIKEHDMISIEIFAKNYERDTVWMHLGQAYIEVVKNYDKKLFRFYIEQYKNLIKKHKNYLEVFNPNETPYSSPFYYADESMLWASMLLRGLK